MKLSPADAALLRAIFDDIIPEVPETAALTCPHPPFDLPPGLPPSLPDGFRLLDRKDLPS